MNLKMLLVAVARALGPPHKPLKELKAGSDFSYFKNILSCDLSVFWV